MLALINPGLLVPSHTHTHTLSLSLARSLSLCLVFLFDLSVFLALLTFIVVMFVSLIVLPLFKDSPYPFGIVSWWVNAPIWLWT
jgi:hypothetical protein